MSRLLLINFKNFITFILLKNLYKSCFSQAGKMRRELFRWVNNDQYGRIFNSPQDNLDMTAHQYMAFDFTTIFQDAMLSPAVISYLMHRGTH